MGMWVLGCICHLVYVCFWPTCCIEIDMSLSEIVMKLICLSHKVFEIDMYLSEIVLKSTHPSQKMYWNWDVPLKNCIEIDNVPLRNCIEIYIAVLKKLQKIWLREGFQKNGQSMVFDHTLLTSPETHLWFPYCNFFKFSARNGTYNIINGFVLKKKSILPCKYAS